MLRGARQRVRTSNHAIEALFAAFNPLSLAKDKSTDTDHNARLVLVSAVFVVNYGRHSTSFAASKNARRCANPLVSP